MDSSAQLQFQPGQRHCQNSPHETRESEGDILGKVLSFHTWLTVDLNDIVQQCKTWDKKPQHSTHGIKGHRAPYFWGGNVAPAPINTFLTSLETFDYDMPLDMTFQDKTSTCATWEVPIVPITTRKLCGKWSLTTGALKHSCQPKCASVWFGQFSWRRPKPCPRESRDNLEWISGSVNTHNKCALQIHAMSRNLSTQKMKSIWYTVLRCEQRA